tara:strand:+ start:501 stop:1178 length:678 start_codon:yes stop_codon:yes gene_type:complete
MMKNLEKEIQKYYQDFKRDFNKENFPSVFKKIEEEDSKEKLKHQHHLGTFAILYTPIRYRPKLLMIGNNPSWFDKDNGAIGYRIVQELMKSPPTENSYIEHNHTYASRMKLIFTRLNRMDLLRNCVGMNRWWLQTGSGNNHFNASCKEKSPYLKESLFEYCETRTKNIISLIEPKVTLLIGSKAQKLMSEQNILNTKIVHVDYPFGAGITGLQKQLEKIIENELL